MKEGWKYEKLGDVASYVNGFAFKPEDWTNNGLPIIRIQNLTEQNKTFNYCKRTDIPQKYLVTDGDVLISWSATLGVFEWKRGLALLNQHIFKVVFDKIKINKQFFIYTIQTSIEEMSRHTNGATMRHIRKGDFDNIKIPVPSLSEQERIVAFLDEQFARIDTLKANAAAQLQAAKDLFQAALKEMLTPKEGWSVVKIGDIFKTYAGGTPLSTKKEYYTNGKIPWINSGEVCQKYIETTKNFITELGLKNSTAKFFPINTVLIALYGATAAQAGILKFEATSNQAVCGLLPNEKMLPEYVYYWFVLNKMKFSSMAQGGAQPNLSQIKVKAMPIPNIPLKEQINICNKLSEIEDKVQQLQANYDKTITLCNDLKQALLKSIFE